MAGTTSTSQVTQAVSAWLDKTLLQRAYPYFLHTRWAQVRPLPTQVGTTIKFRRYTNLTAATTALSEGLTPEGEQLSITDVTASPSQYGQSTHSRIKIFSNFAIPRFSFIPAL
jgi:N4-gp56 family major capsid protein